MALYRGGAVRADPVSYTHLDVYKRQVLAKALNVSIEWLLEQEEE